MITAPPREPADTAFEAGRTAARGPDVVLIGHQDQGNLGMGYLAAVLRRHGRTAELIDVRDGPESIGERLRAAPPLVVGFSLIFQFFLPQYRRVASHLRSIGITSHFTIGGHFPSLCHEEVLRNVPELDSVARFEGEMTLLDLVKTLSAGDDWRFVPGLARVEAGKVIEAPPRPLVEDLDDLPFPERPFGTERIGGFQTLPLLASRGCVRRCSFCSIQTFYRAAQGKPVRIRKPVHVIEEMLELHQRQDVRVFLFQDDDFPLWGSAGRRWADELAQRLHDSGLAARTIFKISCRAEYVEAELFTRLREAGLFLVYMGIESATAEGLEVLHKQMTAAQSLTGVQILKDIGVLYSYGFMLFDPSSTFGSVRENIGFLRRIAGDGSAGAVFSRMLPYGGTPIRDQLAAQGRLRGDITRPDYDFLDPRLNEYHRLLSRAARPWIDVDGLSYMLNQVREELGIFRRLAPDIQGGNAYAAALTALTKLGNESLFRLVEDSSVAFEQGDRSVFESASCGDLQVRLTDLRNQFVAENIEVLSDAIAGRAVAPCLL